MYGSETRPMKKGCGLMLERTEMQMIGKKSSAQLRDRMGIETIGNFFSKHILGLHTAFCPQDALPSETAWH